MPDSSHSLDLASEYVILVDDENRPLGQMEKQEAHELGLLHRAFSVFLLDSRQRFLIQQRASSKYHSKDLWANACCSHPRPEEPLLDAAKRRLREELGIQDITLVEAGSLQYHLHLDQAMQEHEYTHFFVGIYDGALDPNPEEIQDVAWVYLEELIEDVQANPQDYARWFRLYVNKKSGESCVLERVLSMIWEDAFGA